MDWTSLHMQRIPASGTLRMFDIAAKLEAQGRKVYHFEVGQPDFPTPQNIVNAAIEALKQGFTRYVPARGIPPLLEAIADRYRKKGIEIDPATNVIVTPGAKMALFMGALAVIDIGDDVMMLSPSWPSYRVMIRNAGGSPIDVPTGPDFTLDEEVLKQSVTSDTRCIIINSPNNPSGGVLTKDDLKLIYDLACDYDFVIFSDEIYETLVYDGFKQTSMLEVDPEMERTLVINGFSKAYAMTGWRLGYAIGNEETVDNMVRIQQNTTSCATSFVQVAGVEALTGDQSSIERMRREYERRRNIMRNMFCSMDDVSCSTPKGAFYVFP
ncbi:MAG TPA: pyridoxal phosphate-dependent aminotransferase, partial [Candidatus Thorarchaeota archaeon]|nr:pyridoxal phosphate-dependent aminotransferase [Candidatus Thorarchaeota archaeon]